jgi:hypothetical protein
LLLLEAEALEKPAVDLVVEAAVGYFKDQFLLPQELHTQ